MEDPRAHRNHLAQERHVVRFEEQRAADANRWAAQRAAHSDEQITPDASWWAAQRATRNDAHITLENNARANARTLLHPNR